MGYCAPMQKKVAPCVIIWNNFQDTLLKGEGGKQVQKYACIICVKNVTCVCVYTVCVGNTRLYRRNL